MIEVAPSAPIEVVTPIKPSEAIRLGCLTTAQWFQEGYVSTDGTSACVFGAMAIGFGDDDPGHRASNLHTEPRFQGPCPEPGCVMRYFASPAHLNDEHRWTRERIADWLESMGL